ncbi:MAG: UDP-2,3-diacylglucosamine diphosphatase LpxI [Nitrospirae bacterium]|nr:UDP-2,3-diacylglucosamine diphosphatase LpxI [Nitrospirota bacterium]
MGNKLGIIAGDGKFPIIIAEAARDNGYTVIAVAHTGITSQDIEKAADRAYWIKIGQMSKLIDTLKSEGVSEAVMAGGISKRLMFSNIMPDLRALSLLARLKDKKDDTILRAIAGELEIEGIKINAATAYVETILAGSGAMTKKEPTHEEWSDIRFGTEMAREIGRLDIGQCVVVKNLSVIAVEAVEGTDDTILRGGKLANGGAVIIKICKPCQDIRFDLPTVGLDTIKSMKETDARILAVEAGMTIMIDKGEMLKYADEAGISVVGI